MSAEVKEVNKQIKKILSEREIDSLTSAEIELLKDTLFTIGGAIDKHFTLKEQVEFEFYDELTKFYNQDHFKKNLRRFDKSSELPLTVIICKVNDYRVDNKVLAEIAEILKANCRHHDIIGRWSNTEYDILLPRTSSSTAQRIINRIMKNYDQLQLKPSKPDLILSFATKKRPQENIIKLVNSVKDISFY